MKFIIRIIVSIIIGFGLFWLSLYFSRPPVVAWDCVGGVGCSGGPDMIQKVGWPLGIEFSDNSLSKNKTQFLLGQSVNFLFWIVISYAVVESIVRLRKSKKII